MTHTIFFVVSITVCVTTLYQLDGIGQNVDQIWTPTHPNELAYTILAEEKPRRLKRFKPTDLTTGFS
jgi:hypothetical protein